AQGKLRTEAVPVLLGELAKFQSLAMGPGLGRAEGVRDFLEAVLKQAHLPRICDADALNNLATSKRANWRGAILTPHVKEMSRLSGRPAKEILRDPIGAARAFAKRQSCWLVLKGYRTVVVDPQGRVWINSTGGPNLSTAGSGDVLTGILV